MFRRNVWGTLKGIIAMSNNINCCVSNKHDKTITMEISNIDHVIILLMVDFRVVGQQRYPCRGACVTMKFAATT